MIHSYWFDPIKRKYKETYELIYRMGGWYMLLLPILGILKCQTWSPSISFFYYLSSRDILEIMLSGVGLLFLINTGANKLDKLCNRIIFLCCLGVVSFPCDSTNVFLHIVRFAIMHYISAGTLFATFGFCCLYVFRKMRGMEYVTREKRMRNRIYLVAGICIYAGLISVPLMKIFLPHFVQAIFSAEVWMVLWSAVGYLIQGKIILKER